MRAWQQIILKVVLVITIGGAFLLPFSSVNAGAQMPAPLPDPHKIEEYLVRENDSIIYTLNLAYDSAGMPLYFFRNVFTPVCFTDVCKPVYIDLYWDLLGNYIRYEVPETEPLTKVDHEEFTEQDYEHFHRILSNAESILREFTIYELVDTKTYQLSDSVDAVTGATPKTIRSEVIAGAVYTCFTIWHIVHGPVANEIKKITESHCDDRLLHHFLKSDNHHYQYWAMDKVIADDGSTGKPFVQDVLQVIAGKNIFTALHALKKFPSGMLAPSDTIQMWLWSVYRHSHYSLQMAILEKLHGLRFSDHMSLLISADLSSSNEAQFARMLALLVSQGDVPEAVILKIGEHLNDANPAYAAQAYAALSKLPVKNTAVKRQLKEYKKSMIDGP